MAVLTISRDLGSGGLELARRTAELTDYRTADKAVIEQIMREYGFVSFDKEYETTGSIFNVEEELTERTVSFLDKVIRALAKADRVIIVGRGGFAPLAGFSDALHIRVTAPFQSRVDRVFREKGFETRMEAEEFVQKRDKARRNFVSHYYGTHWNDVSHFDLVVDVDKIGVEPTAHLVAEALEKIDKVPRKDPSVTNIEVDSVLAEVVRKRLSEGSELLVDL